MSQFVREDRDAEFAPGQFDGALHIGFMHPVTDFEAGAGMEASVMSREKPSPRPGELVVRVFSGQRVRQHEGNTILFVALPRCPSKLHLLGQFRNQRRRQGNYPVFFALGTSDRETGSCKVHILDAQIQRLANAQPASVKQANDQVGGITGDVLSGLKQRQGLGDRGSVAEMRRTPGAEGVHPLQWLSQDLLIEKENGVESLVLGAGGRVAIPSQPGQEMFKSLLAGKGRGHSSQSGDVTT